MIDLLAGWCKFCNQRVVNLLMFAAIDDASGRGAKAIYCPLSEDNEHEFIYKKETKNESKRADRKTAKKP